MESVVFKEDARTQTLQRAGAERVVWTTICSSELNKQMRIRADMKLQFSQTLRFVQSAALFVGDGQVTNAH